MLIINNSTVALRKLMLVLGSIENPFEMYSKLFTLYIYYGLHKYILINLDSWDIIFKIEINRQCQ